MTKRSNIAIFSLSYAPFRGGAELAVEEITKRLDSRFTCFTYKFDLGWKREEKLNNVRVIRVGRGGKERYGNKGKKFLYILQSWRKAEKEHKQEPFTLIWAIMASYGGMAALLFKFRHPHIPLLLTLQEGDSEKHILKRVGVLYPLWRMLFTRADALQVISTYLEDFARRHGARSKIHIIPNGVGEHFFVSHKQVNQKEKIIITTSRLVHKNGVDILIHALAELKKLANEYVVRLWILGDGPDKQVLKNLARRLGVEEETQFLGNIEPEHIPKFLSQADVFVRPSRSEGLGSSFLEAMAIGLPVIGTPVGGIPDFLEDGETGIMTEIENPKILAHNLQRLYEDKKLYEKISHNGKILVINQYNWDTIARAFKTVFKGMTSAKILFVTGIFPPDIGGPARYAEHFMKTVDGSKYTVEILTYTADVQKGIHAVSRRLPKGIRHTFFLLKLLSLGRNVHVLFANDTSFGTGFLATIAARLLSKQIIVRITGDYAWEQGVQRFRIEDSVDEFQTKKYGFFVRLLKFFQSYTVRKATLVIAPSVYLKNFALHWGAQENKIVVIHNAVEIPLIKKSKEKIKQSLKLEGNVLISAGRLVPWKGFASLISIMPRIKKMFPDITLYIIGSGPEEKALQKSVEELMLKDCVIFLGSIAYNKLLDYLSAADLFVLNTGYEGFSHQIIEAMACGAPVLTTTRGGNPEIVKSGENGVMVPYNDKELFIQTIKRLLNDKSMVKRFSEMAKRTAHQFSEEKMMTSLEKEFDKLFL